MFFKDFRVTFYLQDMKIQSVFFCAQIFRRIARSITPIFFVENWLICRSHLKQFIQCKSENYSIFWLFITSSELLCYVRQFSENTQKSSISLKIRKKISKLFFVNRLAVVSVFLRSGTILKNDHFHCIWSVISLCSTPRAFFPENDDAKCQFGDIFYLFIFFMICCALSSERNSASTYSFGTFLKAFVSLLLFATSISFFLFLTFKTIRRSSLDHCALL